MIRALYPAAFCKKKVWLGTQTTPTDIVIHAHGGGFISMNSGAHQNYLRYWANELELPVFSIDYRLAPAYPYPAAVNDCY
jgi:hormone-sensitive lipase